MHDDQTPYRELHDRLLNGDVPAIEVLAPWVEAHPEETAWLRAFGESTASSTPAQTEDLWRLYALSRVFQVMALRFQHGHAEPWPGPEITEDEWCNFAEQIGLAVHYPGEFSPFDCELVDARHGVEDGEPITLVTTSWPCLMLGSMLFLRAGVSVVGGSRIFDAKVAASSTLYWAFRRKTRPYQDLSHGWGSNSQWRTSFRRDYREGNMLFYNVDGEFDLRAKDLGGPYPEYPLSREERVELLTHRCFIATRKPCEDLWPYDDKLAVATP